MNYRIDKEAVVNNNPYIDSSSAETLYNFVNTLLSENLHDSSQLISVSYSPTNTLELFIDDSGALDISHEVFHDTSQSTDSLFLDENNIIDFSSDRNLSIDKFIAYLPQIIPELRKAKEYADSLSMLAAAKREQTRNDLILIESDTLEPGELTLLDESVTTATLLENKRTKLADTLDDCGFAPKYIIDLGPKTSVYLSKAVELVSHQSSAKSGRKFIVAYTNIGNEWKPQIFYTSQSQVQWRWLPSYSPEDEHYSKGESENAMTLHYKLQGIFYSIVSEGISTQECNSFRDNILHNDEILPQISYKDSSPGSDKRIHEGLFKSREVDFSEFNHQPNISQLISEVILEDDPVYGTVYSRVFHSHDETIAYTFAHTQDGMAWLQSATSLRGVMRKNGLISDEYIQLPELLSSPAYEYGINTGSRPTGGAHPDYSQYNDIMNLISENHLVQDYYRTIPRDELDFMKFIPDNIKPSIGLRQYIIRDLKYRGSNNKSFIDQGGKSLSSLNSAIINTPSEIYKIISDADNTEHALTIGSSAYNMFISLHEAANGFSNSDDTLTVDLVNIFTEISFDDQDELIRHFDHGLLERVLNGLSMKIIDIKTEKYDTNVTYEYWQSEIVDGATLVIAKNQDVPISMNSIPN